MKPRLVLVVGSLLGLLALVTLLGTADTTRAGTFNPALDVTVDNPEPETNSDFAIDFNVPEGDVNFAAVVFFIPKDWGVEPGDQIPIGTHVGTLDAQATLGLINAPCNTVLPVQFTMLNSSLDITDTVSFVDTDPEEDEGFGRGDLFEDKDDSGLADGIEKYPDFLTRILEDEKGEPLQPLRRSAGMTQVAAGVDVLLQFLIFEPGTFINENIPNDESLGYPSVTFLQNIGDVETEPEPNPITDFCTPLSTVNGNVGLAEDGTSIFVNPQDGTYTFTIIGLGQRDADGDGIENGLDTCPFDPNQGDPRVVGEHDADQDGLDAACDPDDDDTNSDEDLDGYLNRGDNCPLVPNGQDLDNQADSDIDQIGDACDPNPDDPDGELVSAKVSQDVVIGAGTGPGGPPEGFPKHLGGEAGGEEGGGGLGTGAIIGIIIGVIAAAVVIGGGAFLFIRRSGA